MSAAATPAQINERLSQIRATLPNSVRLIAVTKTLPADMVRAAYAAGVRDFGESRLQEAIAKQAELTDLPDITWHFIGHLQANKARKVLENFHWIHSVDSLKLAVRLNQLATELNCRPACCLQVKIVPDPPKTGFELAELWAALPHLSQLTHLQIKGLMAIPPQGTDPQAAQVIFQKAKELAQQIHRAYPDLPMTELSMGMSGDYLAAIAAGSTMIRLGTILFGDRPA